MHTDLHFHHNNVMMTQSLPLTVFSPFDGGNSFCFYKTVSKSKDTSLSLSVHIMDSLILKWGHKKTLLQTNKNVLPQEQEHLTSVCMWTCTQIHIYGCGYTKHTEKRCRKNKMFCPWLNSSWVLQQSYAGLKWSILSNSALPNADKCWQAGH